MAPVSFVKVFNEMLHSTVWEMPDSHRVVWITLFLLADENGDVWCTEQALTRAARVRPDRVRKALAALSAPDPGSKTQDHEGRRLLPLTRGWHIVNYPKYRALNPAKIKGAGKPSSVLQAPSSVPAEPSSCPAGGPSSENHSKPVPRTEQNRTEVRDRTEPGVIEGVVEDPDGLSFEQVQAKWEEAGPWPDGDENWEAAEKHFLSIPLVSKKRFWDGLCWAVAASKKEGSHKRKYLGTLCTFIDKAKWKKQKPPAPPEAPKTKKLLPGYA